MLTQTQNDLITTHGRWSKCYNNYTLGHLCVSHNASGLEASKQSMFTLKIFYFCCWFTGGNTCGIKKHLNFVKLIKRMVSYTLGKYFDQWPLVKNVKEMWNFRLYWRQSVYVFDKHGKVTLASTAHERTTLVTIVSYNCNVVAKHWSSKPSTTNELWLLELRINSTRVIGFHTLCIMGHVQIVYRLFEHIP